MKRLKFARTCAFVALATLVAALAGCAKNETTETAGGSPAGESAKPVTSETSPVDALAQAMRAQLSTKSYRVRITSLAPNVQGETVVEYVAPDRIHMTNPISELIAVGSEAFTRTGNGAWQKAPIDAGQIAATFRDPKLIDQLTTNYDIKLIGPDSVDGAPAMVYEYTPKPTANVPQGGKTKIWISSADSLPKKVETNAGNTGSMTTIIYSDYNADLKIELPPDRPQ